MHVSIGNMYCSEMQILISVLGMTSICGHFLESICSNDVVFP